MVDSIRLGDLHGSKLTYKNPESGEREIIATFECDKWPNCDECGSITEEEIKKCEDNSTETISDKSINSSGDFFN